MVYVVAIVESKRQFAARANAGRAARSLCQASYVYVNVKCSVNENFRFADRRFANASVLKRLWLWLGKRHEKAGTGLIRTLRPYRAAMDLRHPLDDRQPQPIAGKISRRMQALKGGE